MSLIRAVVRNCVHLSTSYYSHIKHSDIHCYPDGRTAFNGNLP